MFRLHHAAVLLIAPLCACTEQGGQALTTSDSIPAAAMGLPMTRDAVADLSSALATLDGPDAMRACTPRERDFIRTSLTLYAVRIDEFETQPWTGPQRERIAAMERRWESLGGDAGDISGPCAQALAGSSPIL